MLAFILASSLPQSLRHTRRLPVYVLAFVAIVAVSQEAIQMGAEQVRLGADEIFDFFVDLNGGILGMLLFTKTAKYRTRCDAR